VRPVALPHDVHEPALTLVERFCEECVPPEARAAMRVEHSVRGNAITIVERRPPWSELVGPEWTSMKIAQLRYDPTERTWTLYCADRNERWWPYDSAEPSADIEDLLAAVVEDPTGIFWG
jgi:Protein of unknown function (DUF3024)